jgi:diketogulonate reductase-like aldo/keto reductase
LLPKLVNVSTAPRYDALQRRHQAVQGVQCIACRADPPVEEAAKEALAQVAAAVGKLPSAVLAKWSTQRGVPVVLSSVAAIESVDAFFAWKLDEERDKVRVSLQKSKASVYLI